MSMIEKEACVIPLDIYPRKIITVNDDNGRFFLETRASDIDPVEPWVRKIGAELLRTFNADLASGSGIAGLAANEIGFNSRMILLLSELDDRENCEKFVITGPEIVWTSKTTDEFWFGCRSVPGFKVCKEVPKTVIVRGADIDGNEFIRQFDAENAGVAIHEIDHLDGKTILDEPVIYTNEEYERLCRQRW